MKQAEKLGVRVLTENDFHIRVTEEGFIAN
jgi:hypothetical protein